MNGIRRRASFDTVAVSEIILFPSSQRRARSASPIGRSLKKSCAKRSAGADGVVRPAKRFGRTTPARQLLLSWNSPPPTGTALRQAHHAAPELCLAADIDIV